MNPIIASAKKEAAFAMNSDEKLTVREKLRIAGVTGIFAALGAVLGAIAYYQQWLG